MDNNDHNIYLKNLKCFMKIINLRYIDPKYPSQNNTLLNLIYNNITYNYNYEHE